jgi:hypothetical protein
VSLVSALMPALIDQARFKPGQLALALDEKHGSRYLIGPKRDDKRYAIASGLLNGFGGFLDGGSAAAILLNSPLTKSSLADSVLSSWHGGNQRWRWGGWTRFRMI